MSAKARSCGILSSRRRLRRARLPGAGRSRSLRYECLEDRTLLASADLALAGAAPQLSGIESGWLDYREGGPATPITATTTVADPDSVNLRSATVSFVEGFHAGEDVLGANTAGTSITANFNPAAGLLSFSGIDTLARYQQVLRSVTYENTSTSPNTAVRAVQFWVNDGDALSNGLQRRIAIRTVRAPSLSAIEASPLVYSEGDPATPITATLTIADADDAELQSAAVTIVDGFQAEHDLLAAETAGTGISAAYDPATGVLTLDGADTLAHYQQVLRSVSYRNTSSHPNTAPRTVRFQVNDGEEDGNSQSRQINVKPKIFPPGLSGIETLPLLYTENAPAMPLAPLLTVTDADGTILTSAAVAIAGLHTAEDVLAAATAGTSISADYDAATGVLALSGGDTLDHYQQVLRSVAYHNTSDAPATTDRTVTFVVNDGEADSNPQSRTVRIAKVNDGPALWGIETAELTYTENASATPLTASLTLSDPDDASLAGATVRIEAGFQPGQDLLAADTAGTNIDAAYDAGTGVLTFSGNDAIARYQQVLRSVTYRNLSDDPVTAPRTLRFRANDGQSDSAAPSRTVQVAAVNDAPQFSGIEAAPRAYTENDPPAAISPTLVIADPDDTQLQGGSVALAPGAPSDADLLAANTAGTAIAAAYNSATRVLTLTGRDTVAHYQQVFRSVTYRNTSEDPSAAVRTVTFRVRDGHEESSASRTISVTAVNDLARLSRMEAATLAYRENDPATPITASLTVSDADDLSLVGATVRIVVGFRPGQDVLAATTAGTQITADYDPASGVLVLSGSDTVGRYQQVLRSVSYRNTSETPGTADRVVLFEINDGHLLSQTVHDPVSRKISVAAVNDPPQLSVTETTAAAYTEGDSPAPLAASLAVTDADHPILASATVRIAAGFRAGEDTLAATTTGTSITAAYDPAAGVLTFTGSDTIDHYQQVLRSVSYDNSSEVPNTAPRTVSFRVDDPEAAHGEYSRTIGIAAVNDVPQLSAVETTPLSYAENDPAVAITSSLTVSDTDDADLAGATASIAAGLHPAEDLLAATTAGTNITAAYDAATGMLALTGIDTVAHYQQVLRSVTYRNSSEAPNTAARTIAFRVNDGEAASEPLSRTIHVTAANDPPSLSGIETSALSYTENAPAAPIAASLVAADLDHAGFTGATVSLTAGFQSGQDVLAATTTGTNITAACNPATGLLALSGSDTVAHYQQVLRSVTYRNTSEDPGTDTRTVGFRITDGQADSDLQSRTIQVTAANDPPSLSGIETSPLPYAENAPAAEIAASLAAADLDHASLTGATVSITAGFQSGQDVLAATTTGTSITAAYEPSTGVLALTGSDTVAHYQQVLRTVTYRNTSEDPSTAVRTVSFQVNDGQADSNLQSRTIQVTAANDPPSLSGIETSPLPYAENAPAAEIAASLAAADLDHANLSSAAVSITAGFQSGQDVLAATTTGTNITAAYEPSTGVLTLAGSDTVAHYQQVLRSVTYRNTSEAPSAAARTVVFRVNDGVDEGSLATRAIDLSAVNDAPVVTVPAAGPSIGAGANATATISGISVADADAGTGPIVLTLQIPDGSGTLSVSATLGGPAIEGNNTRAVTLTGTPAQVNAALAANVIYTVPGAIFAGPVPVTVTANDQGNTGDGGAKSDSKTVTIHVGSASLSGYVYYDADGDGIRDVAESGRPVEPGLPGVTVKLRRKDVAGGNYSDVPGATTKTGPDGFYLFDDLSAGVYEIVQTQPEKYLDAVETPGTAGGTAQDNRITEIALDSGMQGENYNFGQRNLKIEYISIHLFLSSTPSSQRILRHYLDLREVFIQGTSASDTIVFTAGADAHTVTVNGNRTTYLADEADVFSIDAADGEDEVTLNGAAGADLGRSMPAWGSLKGTNYMVEALGAEQLKIDGKGGTGDIGILDDSPSSDKLAAVGKKATIDYGGYLAELIAFERIHARSIAGGHDTVEQQAVDFVLMMEGGWNGRL